MRLKETLKKFYAKWLVFISFLIYHFKMHLYGVSEQYIRDAFSHLAQLDMSEARYIYLTAPYTVKFKGSGNQLELQVCQGEAKSFLHNWVLKSNAQQEVYVDEWREHTREVILEFRTRHVTNWWEIYRTGKHVQSLGFVKYLKMLYGAKGEIDAIQKSGAAPFPVQSTPRCREAVRAAYFAEHHGELAAARGYLEFESDAITDAVTRNAKRASVPSAQRVSESE